MAESDTIEMIERFERRLAEIEAQIKPQLDEARALRAGLDRLRRGAADESAPVTETHAVRREKPRRTVHKTASARPRR